MTTTTIADIDHLLDLTDYVGDWAGDYDMDAVRGAYIDAIQAQLPKEVTVLSNGEVLAECDMHFNLAGDWSGVPHDEDGDIDWDAIVEGIDIDAILERHERTS